MLESHMQMPLSSNQRFWIRYFSTVLDTSRYIFCPVHHVGLPFPHWKNFEAWSHSSKIVTFWKIPRTKNYTFLIIKMKTKKTKLLHKKWGVLQLVEKFPGGIFPMGPFSPTNKVWACEGFFDASNTNFTNLKSPTWATISSSRSILLGFRAKMGQCPFSQKIQHFVHFSN